MVCSIVRWILEKISCEDTVLELVQDHVQWQALVLQALNLRVLLPESWFISRMDVREISYVDGRWTEMTQDCGQWWALILVVLNLRLLLK
jgi:hypothetical protein